ncbi:MAG: hypothetical protein IPN96_15820 [Anaerolineales bacterium]|nr:hypothetical protein [Anaerolineales bacterium]
MKTKNIIADIQYQVLRLLIVFVITMSFLAYSPRQSVRATNTILYATSGGLTSGTCSSWASACDLPYALSVAVFSDEIWVKQGIYKPTVIADRTISFVLKDGVSLYGGFVGTETLRGQRASSASLTILSGDIGISGDETDNTYHVVVASGVTNTTIFDGFTITNGRANGIAPNSFGAGMYSIGGSPTLNNLIFDSNVVSPIDANPENGAGGGIYNLNGNPVITNVTFNNNAVTQTITSYSGECLGGGLYNENGNITMDHVTFTGNKASTPFWGSCGGAGIYNKNGTLSLTNMVFSDNVGAHMGWPNATLGSAGGGIWTVNGSVTITHALFNKNIAHFGGGIMNSTSILTLNDVLFDTNTAYYYGGGIRTSGNTGHNVTITDLVFQWKFCWLGRRWIS